MHPTSCEGSDSTLHIWALGLRLFRVLAKPRVPEPRTVTGREGSKKLTALTSPK